MLKQVDSTAAPTADCAFSRCPLPAKFRVKQAQGSALVCKVHFEHIASQEAQASCRALGISTTEQARAYLLKTLPRVGSRAPSTAWAHRILERVRKRENMPFIAVRWASEVVNAERVPGEDDAEAVA